MDIKKKSTVQKMGKNGFVRASRETRVRITKERME
jgi:hypothetical protein